jgi:hypothetical protein
MVLPNQILVKLLALCAMLVKPHLALLEHVKIVRQDFFKTAMTIITSVKHVTMVLSNQILLKPLV